MKSSLFFLVAWNVLSSSLFANEVRYFRVTPNYSYADAEYGCDNSLIPLPVALVVEFGETGIVRAKFKPTEYAPEDVSLLLEPSEVSQMRWFKSFKNIWFTHLPLTERVAMWFMYFSDLGSGRCRPPSTPVTFNLPGPLFVFDMKSVNGGLPWASSQLVRFSGTAEDGRAFSATLSLKQGW